MNTDKDMPASATDELDAWFDKRFDEKIRERETNHTPSMTIIATKGTLDMAYPPFILASTASALGWDVYWFTSEDVHLGKAIKFLQEEVFK